MQTTIVLAFLGLWASITSSAPAVCQPFTDTFEELDGSPVLPQLYPVDTYHGITYKAFSVTERNPLTGNAASLDPESGDKIAGFTMLSDIIRLGTITLRPFGYLEASDKIKSFDLSSLYFGCVINTHTPLLTRSQACDVYIIGYDENGAQGPTKKASFYPPRFSDSPMQLVELPDTFQRLSRVVLALEDAATSQSQSVIFVDDVKHCNRAKA